MAKSKSITEITTQVYDLLFPLEKEERHRVWTATMALLGDTAPLAKGIEPSYFLLLAGAIAFTAIAAWRFERRDLAT